MCSTTDAARRYVEIVTNGEGGDPAATDVWDSALAELHFDCNILGAQKRTEAGEKGIPRGSLERARELVARVNEKYRRGVLSVEPAAVRRMLGLDRLGVVVGQFVAAMLELTLARGDGYGAGRWEMQVAEFQSEDTVARLARNGELPRATIEALMGCRVATSDLTQAYVGLCEVAVLVPYETGLARRARHAVYRLDEGRGIREE